MAKLSPEVLAQCLDDVQSGQSTPEECLASHPALAAELQELLGIVQAITPPPPVTPELAFRALGRAQLITAINAQKAPVTKSAFWRLRELTVGRLDWRTTEFATRRLGMPALIIALILTLTAAAGGGTVYAAQGTLPGDALYPVKVAAEQVQVILATTDQAKAQTYLTLTDKRLIEIQEAIQSGRPAAASMASEALAQEVTQANQHLTQAATSGQDVSSLATRLASNLNQVESALTAAQARAPASAQTALGQALQAATTGLTIASTYVPSTPLAQRALPPVTTVVTGAEPTDTTSTEAASVLVTPGATGAISTTVSAAVTQLISTTQTLQADPLVPGQSYEGLLAKLEAAQAALARGQTDVAIRILDAFLGELNAQERSGHISADNYAALYAGYSNLVTSLGATPKATVIPVRPSPQAGQADGTSEATPTDGDAPGLMARPTPEPSPVDDRRPSGRPTEIPALPSQAAQPTAKPTEAVVPPAVPTPHSKPTEVPPAVPTPRSAPTQVPATTIPSPAAQPTAPSAPTQVPPTSVPTAAAQPTAHSAPTSVPPSPASPQPPRSTEAPTTPPSKRR
ncbi:MAG TPA: DUF5667 domain-containing protein [Chloroflexota bacterium]|nr:DUF5667 domain-containing protein [Chloroflexota bacterium]